MLATSLQAWANFRDRFSGACTVGQSIVTRPHREGRCEKRAPLDTALRDSSLVCKPYHTRLASWQGGHLMVVLDPDVAQVFTTSAAVNAVLRALITTMPKTAARSEDLAQPL